MRERSGLFAPPKHPVLSLAVQAEDRSDRARAEPVRDPCTPHFLPLSSQRTAHLRRRRNQARDADQLRHRRPRPCWWLSFSFLPYHGFPPYPLHRPFWAQVGDHYFYVMYSFVVMGAATVFEWDLLFPDLVDVFVLSVQPIASRHLFLCESAGARHLSRAWYCSGPAFSESSSCPWWLSCLAFSVTFLRTPRLSSRAECSPPRPFSRSRASCSTSSGRTSFDASRLCFRAHRLCSCSPFCFCIRPSSRSLEPLLTSGAPAIRLFPPFWFLGIYERLLLGPSAPAIFHELARIGCYALLANACRHCPHVSTCLSPQSTSAHRGRQSHRYAKPRRRAIPTHPAGHRSAPSRAASHLPFHQPDHTSRPASARHVSDVWRSRHRPHPLRHAGLPCGRRTRSSRSPAERHPLRHPDHDLLDGCWTPLRSHKPHRSTWAHGSFASSSAVRRLVIFPAPEFG